jgi:nucleoside-diphosphate-sugar epimerase
MVLVPGGAGFLGSALTRRLLRSGARVRVVDCFEEHGGADARHLVDCGPDLELERRDAAELTAADLAGVDFIFNCVGLTDHHLGFRRPELDYRLNCASALPLLRLLAQSEAPPRLVSIGSRGQYGAGGLRLVESDRLNPLDIQAIHKTTLEQYHFAFARSGRLRFAYVRLTNTYGPGQRLRGDGIGFVGELVRAALDGGPVTVYGDLDRIKDLLYVDDAVDGLLRVGLLPDEPEPVYNLGGQPSRIGDLVDALAACVAGLDVRVVPFPAEVRRIDTGDAVLDCGKLARATGWEPRTSLATGIRATVDFSRRHRAHDRS